MLLLKQLTVQLSELIEYLQTRYVIRNYTKLPTNIRYPTPTLNASCNVQLRRFRYNNESRQFL